MPFERCSRRRCLLPTQGAGAGPPKSHGLREWFQFFFGYLNRYVIMQFLVFFFLNSCFKFFHFGWYCSWEEEVSRVALLNWAKPLHWTSSRRSQGIVVTCQGALQHGHLKNPKQQQHRIFSKLHDIRPTENCDPIWHKERTLRNNIIWIRLD